MQGRNIAGTTQTTHLEPRTTSGVIRDSQWRIDTSRNEVDSMIGTYGRYCDPSKDCCSSHSSRRKPRLRSQTAKSHGGSPANGSQELRDNLLEKTRAHFQWVRRVGVHVKRSVRLDGAFGIEEDHGWDAEHENMSML